MNIKRIRWHNALGKSVFLLLLYYLLAILFSHFSFGRSTTTVSLNSFFPLNTETTFSNSKTNAIYNIPQLSTGYHLQKGTYHLHWRTAGNSEKILKLSFINNVPIEPALFQLPSDENSGTLEFSVLGDGLSLQIDVSFSGSFLEIKDLQLESCEYTDRAFIIALFLCLLFLGLIYIKSEKTVIGWNFAFIFTGVIAVCYPVFSNTFSLGYDGVFHAARIESIKEGLMTFQFPVRCSSFFYNLNSVKNYNKDCYNF